MVGQWCYIVVQFLQSLLYFFIFLLYTMLCKWNQEISVSVLLGTFLKLSGSQESFPGTLTRILRFLSVLVCRSPYCAIIPHRGPPGLKHKLRKREQYSVRIQTLMPTSILVILPWLLRTERQVFS